MPTSVLPRRRPRGSPASGSTGSRCRGTAPPRLAPALAGPCCGAPDRRACYALKSWIMAVASSRTLARVRRRHLHQRQGRVVAPHVRAVHLPHFVAASAVRVHVGQENDEPPDVFGPPPASRTTVTAFPGDAGLLHEVFLDDHALWLRRILTGDERMRPPTGTSVPVVQPRGAPSS